MENKEEKKEPEVVEFQIPSCCLEGLENCPHVAKPIKKQKTNIGL